MVWVISSHRFRCVMDDLRLILLAVASLEVTIAQRLTILQPLATDRAERNFTTPPGRFCLGLL